MCVGDISPDGHEVSCPYARFQMYGFGGPNPQGDISPDGHEMSCPYARFQMYGFGMPNPQGDISPDGHEMSCPYTPLDCWKQRKQTEINHMPRTTAKPKPAQTTAQQLGSLLKSARDIMRKDKGLNGDLERYRAG